MDLRARRCRIPASSSWPALSSSTAGLSTPPRTRPVPRPHRIHQHQNPATDPIAFDSDPPKRSSPQPCWPSAATDHPRQAEKPPTDKSESPNFFRTILVVQLLQVRLRVFRSSVGLSATLLVDPRIPVFRDPVDVVVTLGMHPEAVVGDPIPVSRPSLGAGGHAQDGRVRDNVCSATATGIRTCASPGSLLTCKAHRLMAADPAARLPRHHLRLVSVLVLTSLILLTSHRIGRLYRVAQAFDAALRLVSAAAKLVLLLELACEATVMALVALSPG